MVQTHQDSREEGTTMPIPPQETEKIWHGSSDLLPTTAQSDCSIKYQIIDLIIIQQTQKYEPLVINMVKSRNSHFENKTFILSVKYGTVMYFIKRLAILSLNISVTLHNLQCYVIIMEHSVKLVCNEPGGRKCCIYPDPEFI
jgi:hypothetical protein